MKILYLIHVCWEWIFQRPQILELLLEKDFDSTVVNKKFILRPSITRNNRLPSSMKLAYQLPKANISKLLQKINKWLYKTALKDCRKYDAVWICHPSLYEYIPNDYSGKIIYDCMDNHVALTDVENREVLKKKRTGIDS